MRLWIVIFAFISGLFPLRETVGTASRTRRMIVFRLKESIEIRSRPARIYPSLVVSSDYVLKTFRPSYVTLLCRFGRMITGKILLVFHCSQ